MIDTTVLEDPTVDDDDGKSNLTVVRSLSVGWIDGCMVGSTDKWLGRLRNGWMNGRMEE